MRSKKNHKQADLFDAQGHVAFDSARDIEWNPDNLAECRIAGMSFALSPAPNDRDRAARLIVDALGETATARHEWQWFGSGGSERIKLESWIEPCHWYVVEFRTTGADTTIYATYASGTRTLQLSVPPRATWKATGLSWLLTFCECTRNRDNPTGWLGNACDCDARRVPRMR